MDPDVDSPAVMRFVAQRRDMGYSWEKISRAIQKNFDLRVTSQTLKRLHKQYSLARKEVVSRNPEFKKRVERDLMYALEKMDGLETEVEDMMELIKRKDVKNKDDYKLILQCVDRIENLLEKRVKMLKDMQPKEQKALKGPTNLTITQNIVNSLEEMKKEGLITINKKEDIIDAEVIEVQEHGTERREDRSGRESLDHSTDGDDSRGVRPTEDESGQGGNRVPEDDGPDNGGAENAPRSGDHSGAPVVTAAATKTAGLRPANKVATRSEPAKGGDSEKGTGE